MSSASPSTQNEQTSRRAAQACNRCRQRRSRCNGETPCSACEKQATECVYEAVLRRRGPGKTKAYIRELEARLQVATQTDPEDPRGRGETSSNNQPPGGTLAALGFHELRAVAGDATVQDSVKASGLEVDPSTIPRQGHTTYLTDSTPNMSEDGSGPLIFSPQISTDDAIKFLESVFANEGTGYPLLTRSLFVDSLSNMDPETNLAGRALLRSLIALGLLFGLTNVGRTSTAGEAWDKFQGAYALLPQIILLDPDILAIEALLAMAIFMRMSADMRTAAQLVSSAIRMYQMVALQNDPSHELRIGASDDRHRRAFWTAYILDKEISILCGLPLAIDEEEFDVVVHRPQIHAHMKGLSLALQMRSEIAVMESEIHKRLYQRKALARPDKELLPNVAAVSWGLGYWLQTAPEGLRPDLDPPGTRPDLDMETLMVHLAYYNCVMASWAARRYGSRTDASNPIRLDKVNNRQITSSMEKSKQVARAILSLLPSFPSRPFVDLWRVLCYPVSATIALLTGVLEVPLSPSARSDAESIASFRQFLERMNREHGHDLHRVLQGCLRMEKLARNAIDKAAASSMGQHTVGIAGGCTPGPWDDTPDTDVERIKDLLGSCTHPMYVAQGLMTNVRNRDGAATVVLSEVLGIGEEGSGQLGLFAPASLWPKTYNFTC
ncbi:hypothetical protein F4802DRAFT_278489 [Xylaria palmicola]|nr:hypothetical protein F4802DRAFT_278489 [Xylaria palmicola]